MILLQHQKIKLFNFAALIIIIMFILSCEKKPESIIKKHFNEFKTLLEINQLEKANTSLKLLLHEIDRKNSSLLFAESNNRKILLSIFPQYQRNDIGMDINTLESFLSMTNDRNSLFDIEDLEYLRSVITIRNISKKATKNIKEPIDKIKKLTEWTFLHVAQNSAVKSILNAYPFEIIERGFGLCDRKAWVFCALARQQGFNSNLVYLVNPQNGKSNHTIANVFLGSKSILVDPTYNVVFFDEDKKEFMGIAEVLNNPGRVSAVHSIYQGDLKNAFSNAQFFLAGHPYAFRPKMKIMQRIFDEYSDDPVTVYVDIENNIKTFANLFAQIEGANYYYINTSLQAIKIPNRNYQVAIWIYPFSLILPMQNDQSSEYNKIFKIILPGFDIYNNARRLHIMGQFEKAEESYKHILRSHNDREILDDITYFLGLLYFDKEEYVKAINTFKQYIDAEFTHWTPHVLFLISKSYKRIGDNDNRCKYIMKLKGNSLYEVFSKRSCPNNFNHDR